MDRSPPLAPCTLSDIARASWLHNRKVRSTRPPLPVMLRADENGVYVDLLEGEAGIANGQACVLYDAPGNEARVFGGGFIDRSERSAEAEAALKSLMDGLAA